MSLRQKLQTTLVALILVVLGLAAVTLWATIQWQRSENGLREHYLRSLLLQQVRASTFRAFHDIPVAISRGEPIGRGLFEVRLAGAERDFKAWTALAHSASEQREVTLVRGAYSALIANVRRVFVLLAAGRVTEAARLMEDQIEGEDFRLFERLSAGAVESDRAFRRQISEESQRIRIAAQAALGAATAATIVLAGLLGYYFVSDLFRPLREVEQALGALGRGDLARRIPVAARPAPALARGRDELSTLVQAFNRTVEELGRTTVSKAYLDSIIDSLVDGLMVAAPDGTIRTANPAAAALLGIPRDELAGRAIAEFMPAGNLAGVAPLRNLETTLRARDGREIPVSVSRSAMRGGHSAAPGSALVVQDITDRRRAQAQIRAALEEKEILFKEVNHRVKNNLQVIDSLLSLQSGLLSDPGAREVLRESRDRVKAMALVHEMLYRTETPSRIDFQAYLHHLTDYLMSSYGTRTVNLAAEIAPASLGLDTAIPCGLLINELVTNSLKHAFPPGAAGRITVTLRRTSPERYQLAVQDDGVGLPAGFRIGETRSLGLRLVRTLAEQIGGTLKVGADPGPGARFEISFAAPPARA